MESEKNKTVRLLSPIATARKVAQRYQTSLPVDIREICREEGIQIEDICFTDIEQKTGLAISSALCNHSERGWVILNNEENNFVQTRFAIARELGHYFLHAATAESHVITSFRCDHSVREQQADKFAIELLMPEKYVREAHQKLVIPVCSTLAEKFGVPESIMRSRLKYLELIAI